MLAGEQLRSFQRGTALKPVDATGEPRKSGQQEMVPEQPTAQDRLNQRMRKTVSGIHSDPAHQSKV